MFVWRVAGSRPGVGDAEPEGWSVMTARFIVADVFDGSHTVSPQRKEKLMLLNELETRFNLVVDDHLDRELTIPVVSGLQRQGDVIVVPTGGVAGGSPIPTEGVAVVRGENGGNTHLLLGDGTWTPDAAGLRLGHLTVPDGGVAVLAHPEHGFNRIGPGVYEVRRQREQADEIRMVQD